MIPRPLARRLVLLLPIALGASCTLLVKDQLEQAPQPCVEASDCFAGFQCLEGACTKAVPPVESPPAPALTFGPAGGMVIGPDGTRLFLPEGALETDVELRLERAPTSLVASGVRAVSRVYRASPELSLAASARIEIPVDEDLCERRCEVYQLDGESWVPLPVSNPDGLLANAAVSSLGLFVVGAIPLDEGPDDGGTPAPASCDFTPGSCAADEQCVPDPFTPGEGLCLGFCDPEAELPAGCDCCATLPGAAAALCLPASLCGDGLVGDACPNGTADCDPRVTDACADLGDGPICTNRCVDDAACSGGCCLEGDAGGSSGLFCQVDEACGALPLGARCRGDLGCASGRCAATGGATEARCTDTCAPGAHADGLCCFPETCAGDSLWVPEDVCEARTTTICGDRCVSDAACGEGAACVDGACQAMPEGACARHAHCDVDERCDPTTAFEETTLGTCVARPDDACFADLHCPPAENPAATLCRQPATCEDDAPCAGTCEVPAPDECLSSDDCDNGEACVAHRCL